VLLNEELSMYTLMALTAQFSANGLITTDIQVYNIKKSYYSGVIGFTHLALSIIFILLLLYYIVFQCSKVFTLMRREKNPDISCAQSIRNGLKAVVKHYT